jgi:hypothetical protein
VIGRLIDPPVGASVVVVSAVAIWSRPSNAPAVRMVAGGGESGVGVDDGWWVTTFVPAVVAAVRAVVVLAAPVPPGSIVLGAPSPLRAGTPLRGSELATREPGDGLDPAGRSRRASADVGLTSTFSLR